VHGQHELFVHIGIWRSMVMRKAILSSRLDVCQIVWILICLNNLACSQFGVMLPVDSRSLKISKIASSCRRDVTSLSLFAAGATVPFYLAEKSTSARCRSKVTLSPLISTMLRLINSWPVQSYFS
jgi:hypothetical protein